MNGFESIKQELLQKNKNVLDSFDDFLVGCLDFFCSKRGIENNEDSQKLLLEEFKNMEIGDFEKLSLICSTFMYVNDPTNNEARYACEHQFKLAKKCQANGHYKGQFTLGNGFERTVLYGYYDGLFRSALELSSEIHRTSQLVENRISSLHYVKNMFGASLTDEDCSDFLEMVHLCNHEFSKLGLIAAALMYVEDPNNHENEEGFRSIVLSEKVNRVQEALANEKNIQFI